MARLEGADTATSIGMPATSGLLHELERRAAADAQHDARRAAARRCSSIRPMILSTALCRPDVLGNLHQRAVDGEESGRMQSARAIEYGLLRPQASGQA